MNKIWLFLLAGLFVNLPVFADEPNYNTTPPSSNLAPAPAGTPTPSTISNPTSNPAMGTPANPNGAEPIHNDAHNFRQAREEHHEEAMKVKKEEHVEKMKKRHEWLQKMRERRALHEKEKKEHELHKETQEQK